MSDLHDLAARHLSLRLRPLNRALRVAAAHQHEAAATWQRPAADGLGIGDRQAVALLDEIDALQIDASPATGLLEPGVAEARLQERMREQARALDARLPLDMLAADLHLSSLELDALLLCLAPELDRGYGRLFAYICDDLHLDKASPELLARLVPTASGRSLARSVVLSAHGRLRRLGLIHQTGEADLARRTLFRVANGVLPLLLGETDRASRFFDPAAIDLADALPLAEFPDAERLRQIADELARERLDCVGIWGTAAHGTADVLRALAAQTGLCLRRWPAGGVGLEEALATAAALDAVLWLEPEQLEQREQLGSKVKMGTTLAAAPARILLSGEHPRLTAELIQTRRYADLSLSRPDSARRADWWRQVLPHLDTAQRDELASRFHFSPTQIRAAARLARRETGLDAASPKLSEVHALEAACNQMALSRSSRFVTLIEPKRTESDLILPADLHQRVLEVPETCRAAALIDESWGFGRLRSGGGATRVLLTGDSGTGKTLTAEVITGLLGPGKLMMKANLAALVSKWVGETEKNLDEVFLAAESSHAVLFFDEADALFGKRGEIQRGSDRYANLEVGFLLQRLEEFGRNGSAALVILASNNKDQIDPAFARRFQIVLHFTRPDAAQRQRLWRIAFPPEAPLSDEVDFEILKQLDLTGAGIVSVARNAALLTLRDGRAEIGMAEITRAIARQFQQEARVLPISELGNHAHWAAESA